MTDIVERLRDPNKRGIWHRQLREEAADEIEKLRAAQQVVNQQLTTEQQHGEPVAWQWLDTATFRKKIPPTAVAAHWRPLFAAPQQGEPVAYRLDWPADYSVGSARFIGAHDTHWRHSCEVAGGTVVPLYAAPQPQGEPVAHLCCGGIYGNELDDWEIVAEQGVCDRINEAQAGAGTHIPLFAAPQQRQPLSDEQIDDIWNEYVVGLSIPLHERFKSACRAVEAAHGIKEKQ